MIAGGVVLGLVLAFFVVRRARRGPAGPEVTIVRAPAGGRVSRPRRGERL